MSTKRWMKAMISVLAAMIIYAGAGAVTAKAATTLPINNSWVNGTIAKAGDCNTYQFTIPSAGLAVITYQARSVGTSTCAIWDEDETDELTYYTLYYSTEAQPQTFAFHMFMEKGTYTVKVKNSITTGGYRLKASFTAAGNKETEPNNTAAQAMTLKSGTKIKGALTWQDKYDFYKITLSKKDKIEVNVLSGVYGDLLVYVLNADETVTVLDRYVSKSGSFAEPNADVGEIFTTDEEMAPGTYYIRICKATWADGGDQNGPYTLWWKGSNEVITVPVSSVKFETATLRAGETKELLATILPADATNQKLKWKSSNKKVATVTSGGVVKSLKAGRVTITATAADGKGAKFSRTFIVRPKKLKKPTVKAKGKKKLYVTWKKVAAASGYEVQYAMAKNFKKTTAYKVKATKLAYTLKKLKSKKNYYVRVRAYYKYNGKNYYGKWSDYVKVKTK